MRLFRFLPLAIPFIVRYVRSPKGKATLNKFLNRRNGSGPSKPGR